MSIEKNTTYGSVNVSEEAISNLVGQVITECYGVVGMASTKVLKDGFTELLRQENFSRGVKIQQNEDGYVVDVYIIVGFGVKISAVVEEARKKVKYVLEKTLSLDVKEVNVFVQGVRVLE